MADLYIPYSGPRVSRAEAIAAGQKLYFTGTPCTRGHVSLRRAVSHSCCQCDREKLLARRPPNPVTPAAMSIETMFARTSPEPNSGCWLWTGGMNQIGYGRVHVNGGRKTAHRVAYELVCGKVPDGLDLDHLCRVRCCINPDHLEPVTRQVNAARGIAGEVSKKRSALITHCPRGHSYSGDNVYYFPGGGARRGCRACWRLKKGRF